MIFSIATLLLSSWHFRKKPAQQILSILIFGISFPLTHFGTEARGYSSLFFFSLLSYILCIKNDYSKRGRWAFNISQILGFISHLSFSNIALALGFHHMIARYKSNKNLLVAITDTLIYQIPTLVFLIILYICDLQYFKTAGGPQRTTEKFLQDTAELFLSRNQFYATMLVVSLFLVILFSGSFKRLINAKLESIVFFTIVLVLSPISNFFISKLYLAKCPPFPRHFVVNYMFALILIVPVCADLLSEKLKYKKLFTLLFITTLALASIRNFSEFFMFGRGQYTKAINFISQNSKQNKVSILCLQFRDCSLLNFYAKIHKDSSKKIEAIPFFKPMPTEGDHWAAIATLFYREEVKLNFTAFQSHRFVLVAKFPSSLFSGSSFSVYSMGLNHDNGQL